MIEPSVSHEKADRLFQRDQIAALFKQHPLEDIEPAILRAITPHYQQRISECRRDLGMTLQNRPRTCQDVAGRVKRLDGAYRYLPDGPLLGRDAGTLMAEGWPTAHGRPFREEFRLR